MGEKNSLKNIREKQVIKTSVVSELIGDLKLYFYFSQQKNNCFQKVCFERIVNLYHV
jgi:hypothetical protein